MLRFVVVPVSCLFLCACEVFASMRPCVDRVLVDVSAGSGTDEAVTSRFFDALLPEVVRRRGTVEVFRLDDVQGAVLVGRFVVGSPLRESRNALAAFERERLAEGKRSLLLLREALFAHPPRSSPLALALTVMSATPVPNGDVRYFSLGDGRETVLADFECRPPSNTAWLSALQRAGALPAGSLQNAKVVFVGMHPLMPIPGGRCRASLGLGQQTKILWETAIRQAGGTVEFQQEWHLDAVAFFFFGAGMLFWRKLRVKYRAWRDRKRARYAPVPIALELLGPQPGLDPSDPHHEGALVNIQRLRVLVIERARLLDEVREELTNHVRWGWLALGAGATTLTEGVAWTMIFRDAGIPSPERIMLGVMCGCFYIVLVGFAAKHAATTGRRAYLIASFVIIALVALAATTVRIINAMTNGGNLLEEACLGALLVCAGLGPAVVTEWLIEPLREVLPLVKRRAERTKQLRETKEELETVTERVSRTARDRRAWTWQYQILIHTYDGINPPPNTQAQLLIREDPPRLDDDSGNTGAGGAPPNDYSAPKKVSGLPTWD